MLDTLRYDEEIKDDDEVFAGLGKAKPRADMLDMAKQLIESRSHEFDPSGFKDHYADALRDLVKRKVESGGKIPVEDESEPKGKVIDFMEALKRRWAAEQGGGPHRGSAQGASQGLQSARQEARPRRPRKPSRRRRRPRPEKASQRRSRKAS